MKTTRLRSNGTAAFATCALVLLALCLLQPANARAQWTPPDANQNINNTNSGNVGIGVTTPTNSLQVGPSLITGSGWGAQINKAGYGLHVVSNFTSSGIGLVLDNVANSTTGVALMMRNNNTANTNFVLQWNGNIGVGNTAPLGPLQP